MVFTLLFNFWKESALLDRLFSYETQNGRFYIG